MKKRRSIRKYKDEPVSQDILRILEENIERINAEHNLHFQVMTNNKSAFKNIFAKYGGFKNPANYISLVAKKDDDISVGYYGEELVLLLESLDIGTCWIAGSYKKANTLAEIKEDEKLYCIISFGYKDEERGPHKSKKISQVLKGEASDLIIKGVEASLLAPTAINMQNFEFEIKNSNVYLRKKFGFFSLINLGIVKYHFEKITNIEVKIEE